MVSANPAARVLSSKAANDGADGGAPAGGPNPDPADMAQAVHDAAVWLGALCGPAEQAEEQQAMNRATTQTVETDHGESPLAELRQFVDALEDADPEDVADLASQAIGILQMLGGSAPDVDGQDDSDDELEAKAAALRLRMKMLR